MTSSQFEVESRAIIPSGKFDDLCSYFAKIAISQKETKMKTFLFNGKDTFARLRITSSKPGVTLTIKEGDYSSKARKETEKELSFDEVPSLIMELKDKGCANCSYIHSRRISFVLPNGLKVELSQHEFLGDIIEVEKMVNTKEEIDQAYANTLEILDSIKLSTLKGEEYQKMMDKLYADTLRPAENYLSEMMTAI